MNGFIAILKAVVEVLVRGGAERNVIQAGDAEGFAHIFVESVEGLELRRERGEILAGLGAQEHLIAAADQGRDFASDQNACLVEFHFALACVLDDGSATGAGDFGSLRGFALDVHAGRFEFGEVVIEGQLAGRFVAEEHKSLL